MKFVIKTAAVFLLFGYVFLFFISCGSKKEISQSPEANITTSVENSNSSNNSNVQPQTSPTSKFPNLQSELLDDRNKTTDSPLGKFDFKNYTYPLPRGWQDADSGEATLENGVRRGGEKTIGLAYVTTKYFDVTGDGQDEAIVILKILTAGSAIPQTVYVFTWKDGEPKLLWDFRAGDRADGGLKDLRAENGDLVVELYGQDRFLLGDSETSKITGDEEQLCCPTFFTRTRYKWSGDNFRMLGKRETYSLLDKDAQPQENLGDIVNEKGGKKK